MLKLLSSLVVGLSVSVAGTGSACACGGGCGCQPNYAPASPNGGTAQSLPPDMAGRQTYRSYSYEAYRAPMMRRSGPSYSNQFRADRKIRGIVN